MANTHFQSVDDYIALQPEAVRGLLKRVRSTIRKAVPRAEERISYQMPAYKVDGTWVLGFAGWKEHFSLYPFGASMLAAFGDEVKPYVASKGTLRFLLAERVPLGLIGRIAKLRAAEAAAKAKRVSAKKPRAKAAAKARSKSRPKPAAKRSAAARSRR